MSVATAPIPVMERYRLSSTVYHQMVEQGILDEDARVELIEGELISMPPMGSEHSGIVNHLAAFYIGRLAMRAVVSVQNAVHLNDFFEPQPDVALLAPRSDFYKQALPTVSDVLLVVEVADSSLAYDRTVKAPLYAHAGLPEVWIVNLIDRWIEVYRDPSPAGYTTLLKILPGKSIAPLAFSDVMVDVADLLAA